MTTRSLLTLITVILSIVSTEMAAEGSTLERYLGGS
jgi:hypothetical protein